MFCGRFGHYIKHLWFQVSGSATHTSDGDSDPRSWGASLVSNWIANSSTLSSGVNISIASGEAGGLRASAGWEIHFSVANGSRTYSDSGSDYRTSLPVCRVMFKDVKLYCFKTYFRFTCSAVEFWVDGSLASSQGGLSIDSNGLANGYLPIVGVPPTLTPGGGWSFLETPPTHDATVSFSATGGWGYVGQDDVEHGWPCACSPTYSCDTAGGASPGTVSVTDTGSATVTGHTERHKVSLLKGEIKAGMAYVTLVPTPPRSVVKLNGDYGALVARLAVPGFYERKVKQVGATQTESANMRFSNYSAFLGLVQDADHAAQEMFGVGAGLSCPYRIEASYEFVDDTFPRDPADPDGESCYVMFPSDRVDADSSSYLTFSGPDDYITNVTNMVNTHYSPGWAHFLWYPPDGLANDSAVAWKIDGAAVDPSAYWIPDRTQLASNPGLPSDEKTKQRLQVVAEPLSTSGLAGFVSSSVAGQPTSWWGVSRFDALEVTLPSSLTLGAHGAWSGDSDCSLSFDGSNVVVTPVGGATSCKVTLALMGGVQGLGFYNLLADTVTLAPFAAGTVGSPSLSAAWVDYAGKRVDIGAVTSSSDHSKPYAVSSRYAGTWAEDWGQSEVEDLPVDVRGSGRSLSVAGDASAVASLPLSSARQYTAIEFTLTGLSGAAKIPFPVLKRLAFAAGNRVVSGDHGGRQFCLQKNASAFRYGVWKDWDGTNILDWPDVEDYTLCPSALSALALRRWVQGNGLLSGLDTEIRGYYEYGVEFTLPKHLVSDPVDHLQLTSSFLMPATSGGKLYLAMMNGFREFPPLCSIPNPKRGSDWQPDPGSGFDNSVYTLCRRLRHAAEPDDAANSQVFTLGGSALSSTGETAPDGWRLYSFDPKPLDGTETGYLLKANSKIWMRFRPWRGFVFAPGSGNAIGVSLARGLDGAHHEVVWDTAMTHHRNDWGGVSSFTSSTLLSEVDSVGVTQSFRDAGRIHYTYVTGGKAFRAWSDDDGHTLIDTEQISGDDETVLHSCPVKLHDGTELELYSVTAGDGSVTNIKVKRYNLDGSVDGPWTVGGGSPVAFELATFGVREDAEEQKAVLSAFKSGETSPTRFYSDDDGETWAEA